MPDTPNPRLAALLARLERVEADAPVLSQIIEAIDTLAPQVEALEALLAALVSDVAHPALALQSDHMSRTLASIKTVVSGSLEQAASVLAEEA